MSRALPEAFARWLDAPPDGRSGAGLDWVEQVRAQARARVGALGVPDSGQEAWRYTSLKRLLEAGFGAGGETLTALQPADIEELLIPGLDSHRVLLANGRLVPGGLVLGSAPPGLRVGGLRDLLATDPELVHPHFDRLAGSGSSVFAALNTAALDDGLVLRLEPGVRLERPLELIHLSVGMDEPRVAQPRHLIVLGEGAQATLIERHVSLGDALYCTNTVLEIALAPAAGLIHERIQLDSPRAFHLSAVHLRQEAGSRYRGVNLCLGGTWSRTELQVRLEGEDCDCELPGLYLAGDGQLMDVHLDVRHASPRCASRENFKGILHGRGRAVFDGRVLVERAAQKTDAAMSNRNLMLSEQAEVDTKPQLEILADDVRCSHGTTVGQIEPEQLFYLRSRGIPAPLARRMLCLGFAGEILDALDSEPLREQVAAWVGQRLDAAALD